MINLDWTVISDWVINKFAGGIIALIGAVFAIQTLKKWYRPIYINPSYCLYADNSSTPDEIRAEIINRSSEPQYIVKCVARGTYSRRYILKRHFLNPLLKPSLYPDIWYGPVFYNLMKEDKIKLEPYEPIKLSRKLSSHPLNAMFEPYFFVIVTLSSGKTIHSRKILAPRRWRFIGREYEKKNRIVNNLYRSTQMDIDKKAVNYVEKIAKDLSGLETVKLYYDNAEYYIKFMIEDYPEKSVIIKVFRRHIIDLNFLISNENSPDFHSRINLLKYFIIAALVEKNIIPQFCVSDAMITEKGNWIDPEMGNAFSVSFDSKMTAYVADGLKMLSEKLDEIIKMHNSFDLSDYKESKEYADRIYGSYQKQSSFNSSGISIKSLQFLKAASVCRIILFEEEKSKQKISRIINEIDKNIFKIAAKMHDQVFYSIKIPDFIQSIKELYSHETGLKINSPMRTNPTNDNSYNYDISFSLAHEQHNYVDKVYNHLRQLSPALNIFYYRDEPIKIELWGKNQADYLQQIYRDKSKHVIIFISKDFVEKKWTKHEWRSVQEAILSRPEEYLLPARFDDSELAGLHSTINYVSLKNVKPEDFAEIIIKKVESLHKNKEGGKSLLLTN